MRVAYFTESLYPHVDGVSRTLARLFATLEQNDVDFRIYSPFLPGAEVSWRGRVRRVPYVPFPLYPDYRVSLPALGNIRKELRDYAPDLLHVVSPTPLAYRAQGLGSELGIPVVASFHTHFVSYFRYYGLSWLEGFGWRLVRGFYKGCARVYAPTRAIIAELAAHGIERLELWSRGIDIDSFSPANRDESLVRDVRGDNEIPILLLVSRLVKEKDLADLVEVNRILRARSVSFWLALVGDGPMRGELERALPDAVFAGHRTGQDLARWYASADVFVFPSTTETLGNVVLEALASGVPAVVVDRGGPQDLIENGVNGFVSTANDPTRIADHLQPLLEDRALRKRMSIAARASAMSRDWETINSGLLASYAEEIEGWRVRTGAFRR